MLASDLLASRLALPLLPHVAGSAKPGGFAIDARADHAQDLVATEHY